MVGTFGARRGVALVALAVLAAGCGGSSGGGSSPTAGGTSTGTNSGTTGGATAPGITSSSLTLGNVSVLSGPIPGLFQGAPYGVEAYFAKVNADGGVNGRKLELKSYDDALNCNQNSKGTTDAVQNTFALVGSFSIFDQCGAAVLGKNPTVPSVGFALGDATKALANQYSPQPAPPGYRTGFFKYLKQKYPDATTVGTLYGQGAAQVNWQYQSAALKSLGYKVGYERQTSPTETNFTSDVLRMKSGGVNFLYLTDLDVTAQTRLLNAAHQQGWRPTIIYGSSAYDGHFFKLLGNPASAEGMLLDEQFAMFLGEDRATTKGVDEFLTWMGKTKPDFQPDLYAMYGWVSAQLFVDALQQAGKNPTRQGVLDALKNIHSFNADGMLATADVGAKKPPECWYEIVVHDGKFVRELPKDKGFTCNPTGYYYAKAAS